MYPFILNFNMFSVIISWLTLIVMSSDMSVNYSIDIVLEDRLRNNNPRKILRI